MTMRTFFAAMVGVVCSGDVVEVEVSSWLKLLAGRVSTNTKY